MRSYLIKEEVCAFLKNGNAYARGAIPRKHIEVRSLVRQRERSTSLFRLEESRILTLTLVKES